MNTDCCSGLPRPHPAKDPERDIHPLGPDQERQAHPAGDLIWIKYASLHVSSPCFSAYALVGLKAATEDFFFSLFLFAPGDTAGAVRKLGSPDFYPEPQSGGSLLCDPLAGATCFSESMVEGFQNSLCP